MTTVDSVKAERASWPDARERYARATKVLPGGNSRTQLYVLPHPVYAARGSGHTITLTDGRQVTDFVLNYTACAVGYAHPEVLAAAAAALEEGGPFGMPTPYEITMAEALQARVPSMERVRFTNSGSEATLHAFRTARAFSGRSMIAKVEGAYHGSHDLTDFSVSKLSDKPLEPKPQTPGMPPGLIESIVLIPFNDLPGTIVVLDSHRDELATVVVEPFLNSAGVLVAEPEYLQGVARWCRDNGVLLTIDEVASFRTSYHGAHSDYGITGDLVCLGKTIGGGFAAGAFGGREDVMALLDPRRQDHIKHTGTFNAHPVTMAAGAKVLEILSAETIERMNRLGEHIVEGVRAIGRDRGIALTATSYGSVGNIHLAQEPPSTPRETGALVSEKMLAVFWALLDRGYSIAPRGQFSTCAVTTDEHVDGLLEALDAVAAETLR